MCGISTPSLQKERTEFLWIAVARFVGLVPGTDIMRFVEATKQFDNTKVFNVAALKDFGSLNVETWKEFIDWVCNPDSSITNSTVWKMLRYLRRKQFVPVHILHPENPHVHPSKRMLSFS